MSGRGTAVGGNCGPVVRLSRVAKRHGEGFALWIEGLEVFRGEVFCLLGPTGAGKSTLLRILAGLARAESGSVEFDGVVQEGGGWPLELERRITLVFQRPLLLSGTVRSNVEYGLRLRRMPDRSARVVYWLRRLGLDRISAQAAHTLSGGQTQLVALARALAIEPDLLLLDEPTANLDPAHVALVEQVVREENDRRGTTVVWATHNLFQARRVATRVGLMLDGQLIEVAEREQFFRSPADPRTADFVQGKMIY